MRSDGTETRRRILTIVSALFADKGFAATSMADIAVELGTSKAALYYHFRSKAAILDALLAEPLAAYTALAETADDPSQSPTDLLAAVIDTTIAARSMLDLLSNDPSAKAHLDAGPIRTQSARINASVVAALAGPDPTPDAVIRAHAAYTVAKHATLALLATGAGHLDAAVRAELLSAAARALRP